MKNPHSNTHHKRILTEIPLYSKKTAKFKPNYSYCFPLKTHNKLLPRIEKSFTKCIKPSTSIVKNYKIINKIGEKASISKNIINFQRLGGKTSENRSDNKTKNAIFPRKSCNEYYNKISEQSNYTSFTKLTNFKKIKIPLKESGNSALTEGNFAPFLSICKTVTEATNMSTLKHPNDIEAVKTPEDLHYFFAQMIQKGRTIEFNLDIDNDKEFYILK